METRHVPAGIKILIGVGLYILTFLLARPSSPITKGEYAFWNKAAALFGENDVDGFIGIALLIGCTLATVVGYQIIVRVIEKRLSKQ
ncbi:MULTISPECIES: hypothetical protein [Serratia]|nr:MULTISPECIES: hypothetical protein [Serratia]AVU33601.1 hypothetical protein AM681_02500 [Serratia marcescens]AVU38728.1 hypothetical protein AS658_02490 [Serratia marcescens]EIJ7460931.1 hypothetical protein [Serratia marcescens]EIU0886765.1 hypothetical protein [Serratia marcescens]EJA2551114.1 hypothetical protein [Serratia marcescens]